MILFLYLLVIHWLADFVAQTHWMAINKSKSNKALLYHVSVYTLIFGLCLSGYAVNNLDHLLLFLSVNFVLHFITDYITSRKNSILWTAGRTHDFFVMVGLDQLIHQLTLALTMYWFLI